jgi:hypothetical protein
MSVTSSVTTWYPPVQSDMSISLNIFRYSNNDLMQSCHFSRNYTTSVTVKSTDRRIRLRRCLAITVKCIVQQLLNATVTGISSSSSYHHRLLWRSLSLGQACKTRNPQSSMMSSAHVLLLFSLLCFAIQARNPTKLNEKISTLKDLQV